MSWQSSLDNMSSIKKFCCAICGSSNIQIQAWVNANTHEYIDNIGDDNTCWCEDCCQHTYFILKKNMEIVKLYSEGCGPCKVLDKMLKDNNVEYESIDINSDKGTDIAIEYSVRGVPALLVFDENKDLLRKKVGLFSSINDLNKFLYEHN